MPSEYANTAPLTEQAIRRVNGTDELFPGQAADRISVWALVQVDIPVPAFPDSPASIAAAVQDVLSYEQVTNVIRLYDVALPETAATLQSYPKPKPKPEKTYVVTDMPADYAGYEEEGT
jgi:hypothetical protein